MEEWQNQQIKSLVDSLPLQELDLLNIDDFIEKTNAINLSVDERLRQLAIFLEWASFETTERKWRIIQKIYDLATEINPTNHLIFKSKGITASELFSETKDKNLKELLFAQADSAFEHAIRLEPEDAYIYFHWGKLHYAINYELAVQKFLQAVELDKTYTEALLYLGYCYFDLNQWQQALYYFEQVNEETIQDFWERTKRHELIGCCLVEVGNREEGITYLEKYVFTEYRQGKYHSMEEDTLVYPTEMVRTLKKINQFELVTQIELWVA